MSFRVSGKNIEVGEALRERISARVVEALEKYFNGGGHKNAAGGQSSEPLEMVVEKFRNTIKEYKNLLNTV